MTNTLYNTTFPFHPRLRVNTSSHEVKQVISYTRHHLQDQFEILLPPEPKKLLAS
jgi:hypothetical protein